MADVYARKIISSFGELREILKEKPTTHPEIEDCKKRLKKYEKLVDQWMNQYSKEIKRIEKIFLNCNTLSRMFSKTLGYNRRRPICSEIVEKSIEKLFNAFKKSSKKFSKILKDIFLNFDLKQEDISDIFDSLDILFDVVCFEKSDMLKMLNTVFELMEQDKNDITKEYKRIDENIDSRLKNLKLKFDTNVMEELYENISEDQKDLYGILKNESFVKFAELLADVDDSKVVKDYSVEKLSKIMENMAQHTLGRAHFRAKVNELYAQSGGSSKCSMNQKIIKIHEEFKKSQLRNIEICEKKINRKMDDFISKKSNEKPQLTNRPLPIPPVRGKSSSDVPKKPLPTPQKNSGDKKNRGSKYLSEEEIQRLESALKNGPNSKKKSVQTSDGTPSSNDKSKNLEIPNDESKEPSVSSDKSKKSKKRRSGLFRKHPKDDNATNDKSKNSKNPNSKLKNSWRKSLKKRLSGSFGRPSKTSNDTSTSSSNDAHQEELKKAVKRRSLRINPDEIPTES